MLYEEYEQKIIKKAKVLRVLYRFRVLIILAIVLVLGSGGTLAGTKGVVMDKKKVGNTYYYGEIYEYLSEAFLSEVDYEFSYNHSEEWTSELPRLIGHYTLRSKSKNIVNSYYYGALQEFDIVPKPIDVQVVESSITYGEKPTINISSELEYGDVLSNEYKFDYGDMSKKSWDISPIESSLHIFSPDGNDVTNCYRLNLVSKNVSINKRALGVTSPSSEKTYDGEGLFDNNFEIVSGNLAFEDKIVCDNYTSVTEASTVLNNQRYIITNKDGVNVTDHYDVSLNPGTLSVKKRPITVSSDSYEFTYDGLEHKFDLNTIKLEGTLADGETIQYEYVDSDTWVDAKTYSNSFSYKVLKGETDVTKNYEVTTKFGKTLINPRPLKLSSPSYEHTYNGKNQKFELSAVVQEGTLAQGENLVLTYDSTNIFRDAGNYSNIFNYKVMRGEKDVTNNYSITSAFGTTVINKRLISFTSDSYEYMYNATNQIFGLGTIATTQGELAEGENVEFSYGETKEMFDAGEYTNEYTSKICHGEEDVSKNYQISQVYGKTNITKRPIKFTSPSYEFVYDGFDHKFELNTVATDGELAEGDKVTLTYKDDNSWIRVGEYSNEYNIVIKHDERDVTKNYDITTEFGKTTIKKCPITITTEDVTKTYDAIPVINKDIVVKEGNIATTDKFEVTAPSFEDAGIYKNEVLVSIVNKESSKDFTDCYDVTLLTSTITINKVQLEIQIEQNTVVYNGKEHTNSYHISDGALVGNDAFKTLDNISCIDAGTYDNDKMDLTVLKEDDTNNLKNYELTYKGREDALIIEKRAISLTIFSFEKLYDAIPIQDTIEEDVERYEISSGTFAEDEYMTIDFTNNPTNAGEYNIDYELHVYHKVGETIDPSKDREVTFNYEFSVTEGKYKINQRTLDIYTVDYEHVYNRVSTFTKNEKVYEISDECDGLVENQNITAFDITCEELNVGTYSYDIDYSTFKIEDKDKNDVTRNYQLGVKNNGKVTIIKRDINVDIKSKTFTYEGKNLSSDAHSVSNILSGDYLKFTNLPTVRHVAQGQINNEPESISVYMSDDTDVTGNYNIIVDSIGTISIIPREIILSTSSFEKTFDGQMLEKDGVLKVKEGTLADCDTLTTTALYSKDNDYVHVIETDNLAEFTLIDDEDTDVYTDYSITFDLGKIKIKPCEVTVDVYSTDIVYDGNTYSVHEVETNVTAMSDRIYITKGSMPDLYYLDVEVEISGMQKPQTYNYETVVFTVRTDCIYGFTDNDFRFNCEAGSQRIIKRQLVIQVVGGSKIYDGEGFFAQKNEEDIWYISSGSLALGDTIYEIYYDDFTEIGEYGGYGFQVLTILDTDTMEDVTSCYDISYRVGGIIIYEQ